MMLCQYDGGTRPNNCGLLTHGVNLQCFPHQHQAAFQKKNPAVIHDFCTTNFPIKNQVNSWIGKFITVRPMDPKNGCDLQVNHNVYSYSAVIAACHKGYQWFLGNVPTFLAAFFFEGAI